LPPLGLATREQRLVDAAKRENVFALTETVLEAA